MKRREFIAGVGGAALAWPIAANAQQTMPVIGFLHSQSLDMRSSPNIVAFRQGLSETGFVEGKNVAIEFRWGQGQFDRMTGLAAELVAQRVDVLVGANGAVVAAKAATKTIPIVARFGGDPVKNGFVASLNRPGGNITGVGLFAYSLGPKRFELLRDLMSSTRVIAVLVNRSNPDGETKTDAANVEVAARAAGQQVFIANATSENDFEPAFVAMVEHGAGALLVMADPLFAAQAEAIVALAARHAIPAIYEWRDFAMLGGLMSYGSSTTDSYRKLGFYTGKVLSGAKPADLPIDQAVKVELVINLKTAKTLGLTFPITLLGRADEVIE